jgi:hypothetical protein
LMQRALSILRQRCPNVFHDMGQGE